MLPKSTPLWSKMLEKLPRNIYNFTIRYLSNTLPNGTNAKKWGIKNSSICTHCGELESLGHVVGGCSSALKEGRFNWRHNSILKNLALPIIQKSDRRVYCDVDGFLSPTIITTEDFRPDLVITTNTNIYIVELTVGFETNIRKNEERKQSKYTDIINNLSKEKKVLFVNLSMGACGVVGKESGKLFSMLKELGMNEMESHFLIRKLMNVCIRSTYFIFCKREKAWEGPDLLVW